jgi:hypothetical protein
MAEIRKGALSEHPITGYTLHVSKLFLLTIMKNIVRMSALALVLIIPLVSTPFLAEAADESVFEINTDLSSNHPCVVAGAKGEWRGWCMMFGNRRMQRAYQMQWATEEARAVSGVWGPDVDEMNCLEIWNITDRRACSRAQRAYLYANVRGGVVAPRIHTRRSLR